MKIASLLVSASLSAAALLSTSAARADISPPCDQIAADPNCTEALVGKLCPDKSTVCSAVPCNVNDKRYQCEVPCPVDVADPDKVCGDPTTGGDKTAIGKACGDGGTCSQSPCIKGAPRVTCNKPAPLPPDGQGGSGGGAGSAGASGSSAAGSSAAGTSAAGSGSSDDDSGCAVATRGARRQGALAGLMLALGAAALLAERRKR